MSVLSDASLRALVGDSAAIGPASIDLHLGTRLLRLGYGATLDPEKDQSALWQEVPLREDGRWCLGARELYLAVTDEVVAVPGNMVALLHGVSSLGRLGLLVHVTAGLIDSGNALKPTLELVSLGGAMLLRPGQRIAQVTYHMLDQEVEQRYSGRYLGDTDVTPSRSWKDVTP